MNPRSLTEVEERKVRQWCWMQARRSAEGIERLVGLGHTKNARREARRHLARQVVQVNALFQAARKRWPTKQDMTLERREQRRLQRLQAVFDKLPQVGKLTRAAKARRFCIRKDNGR
ncbi:hypothetical protein RXV95_12630 [Novosphingobium sp. ZN18A2]|uniref:hypothetical protein n=1 Tax=Novosphingobium sp. ZN18A2 TaxID=3079861 RepID=UPI0030CAEFD4